MDQKVLIANPEIKPAAYVVRGEQFGMVGPAADITSNYCKVWWFDVDKIRSEATVDIRTLTVVSRQTWEAGYFPKVQSKIRIANAQVNQIREDIEKAWKE